MNSTIGNRSASTHGAFGVAVPMAFVVPAPVANTARGCEVPAGSGFAVPA